MDAVVQRIPHQDRQRNGFHNSQCPAETVEETTQSEKNSHDGDKHGQDEPVVM